MEPLKPFGDRPGLAFLVIGSALVAVVTIVGLVAPPGTGTVTSDLWAHSATLREWGAHLTDPGHPHLPLDIPSPRYVPAYLPLAALVAAGVSPLAALGIGAGLGTTVLLAGLYLFYRSFFPERRWAPVLGLGVLLFAWGIGNPWSGLFEFRSMMVVGSYPSTWAFGAALATVAMAIRTRRSPRPWALAGVAFLAWFTVLTHPPTAVFAFAFCGAVALADVAAWRKWLAPAAAVVAGVVVAFAWPFFSLWELVTGGTPDTGVEAVLPVQFYEPIRVILLLGPLLLGLWAVTRVEDPAARRAIAIGFVMMASLWLANVWLPVPLGDRFFFYGAFFLQVALVGGGAALVAGLGTRSVRWVTVVAVVAVGVHLAMGVAEVAGRQVGLRSVVTLATFGEDSIRNQFETVAAAIPSDGVVMASESVRWPLPTFAGKVVAVDRETFFVDDTVARLAAAARFFDPVTSGIDRVAILDRYGAFFVAYDVADVDAANAAALDALGRVVASTESLRLVAVE